MKPTYESPLASRYASKTMLHLFSPDMRYETWRRLWVALARAEHNLGLPVTQAQVDELAAHVSPIDYDVVAAREKEVRHDVMAHIYAYGLDAPGAKGVIHLGATSCYVTDNADLILYREALRYLERELKAAMRNLCEFADRYAAMPALAYTHYQPAQLTTVGKRASLWLQDLTLDLEEVQDTLRAFRFLGCRGTTGTEASFVELFDGDTAKIDEMNRQIAAEFGFKRCYPVCGQTYPRKLDSRILNALSSICQSACRMATDIRLLQHDRQVEEPFEDKQIGSSAMAYKRNPMRCERICSLSRYLMADAMNAPMTASVQWLERTLVIAGIVLILADFIGVMRALRTSSATRLNKAGQETTQRMADRISNTIWRRLQKAYPGLAAADVPGPERYVFAQGICFDKLVWVFLVTSFLGALIEMVFCRVTSGQWMSRSGVLYGSFSFVWGLGAVVLTITLQRIADKPDRRIFLAGFVIGGAYEYLCSVFTELVFGTVFWDYSKMPLNIGGRTNVLYCIFWGLLAVAWIKVLYPPMSKGIEKISPLLGKVVTWVIIFFLACDGLLTGAAMLRYTDRQNNPEPKNVAEAFLDNAYDDDWMEHHWPNMVVTKDAE